MNEEKLKKVRDELNRVSPSFCMAKWYHVSIHLHTGVNHSCYHPAPHKISLDEIKQNPGALHNTQWKKEQRKMMLEGIRPPECSYCWAVEDLDGDQISDRYLRSSEEWAYPYIDEIKNLPWDADVFPKYLEVNFGNECQFKCSYCTTSVSSSWFNETRKFGNWPLRNPVNRGQYDISYYEQPGTLYKEKDSPYVKAFWKWLPDVYKHLYTLRITGGEPLLSSNVYKVLDFLDQNPNPNLEFSINSNMGVPRRNVEKFVYKVKKLLEENKIRTFRLYTSTDTWGPQAEWIRNGLNLEHFESNIRYYLDTIPNSNVGFMVTFCALAIPSFNLFLDKILELRKDYGGPYKRIHFDTPYTIEPPHLVAPILDDRWVEHGEKQLQYLKDRVNDDNNEMFTTVEYRKLERAIEWIKATRQVEPLLSINRADFYRFVIEHDRRRGTNFLEAFPEMKEFLDLCKTCNETIREQN